MNSVPKGLHARCSNRSLPFSCRLETKLLEVQKEFLLLQASTGETSLKVFTDCPVSLTSDTHKGNLRNSGEHQTR